MSTGAPVSIKNLTGVFPIRTLMSGLGLPCFDSETMKKISSSLLSRFHSKSSPRVIWTSTMSFVRSLSVFTLRSLYSCFLGVVL